MLAIIKSIKNPLETYSQLFDIYYDNLLSDNKKTLRENLLREQGYLCAYCMQRIADENMHIEHWFPQNPHGKEANTHAEKETQRLSGIDYKNLLAVCPGGKGKPKRLQHCDTRKGNTPLTYNPANPEHAPKLRIHYSKITGEISSDDVAFNKELVNVLNLNLEQLKTNRKAVMESVRKNLGKLGRTATKADLTEKLNFWKTKGQQDKLPEFAGVAIYVLENRLRRLNNEYKANAKAQARQFDVPRFT